MTAALVIITLVIAARKEIVSWAVREGLKETLFISVAPPGGKKQVLGGAGRTEREVFH